MILDECQEFSSLKTKLNKDEYDEKIYIHSIVP